MKGKRHGLGVCFLLAVGLAAGCRTPLPDVEQAGSETQPEVNKSLFAAVRKADRLVLYEGLPHQHFEAKLLEKEKQQKRTVTLHDYPFYADPLDLSEQDSARLKEALSDAGSFLTWRGEKWCGGFHPDYLVECHVGETVYRFLLCFGCHEAKAFGPGADVRLDIPTEAYQQLKELLEKYRKNRPTAG